MGQGLLYTGALAGANETGLLDKVSNTLSSVNLTHMTMVPAINAIQWGLRNLLWVAIIVGGIWYWQKGHSVVMARLRAHQNGSNLSR